MNNKILSIIIPVYNCEEYIERCLNSLIPQITNDCEIIVINDGSTDKTGDIIEHFASINSCIVYLNRQNGGVSFARNEGLATAQGKYIMFCDADDWYEDGSVSYLINMMEQSNADIGKYGAFAVTSKKKMSIASPLEPKAYDKTHLNTLYLYKMVGPTSPSELNKPTEIAGNIWSHIIRRSVISDNNIQFDRRLFHSEDQLFIINVLAHCNKMVVTDKCFYNYYHREGSAVRSFNSRITQNALDYCALLEQVTRDCGIYEQTAKNRHLNYVRTCFTIAEYVFSSSNASSKKEKLQQARISLDRKEFNDALSELDLNGIKMVYKMLYRCLKRRNYVGYMIIKDFRNFIYKLRH